MRKLKLKIVDLEVTSFTVVAKEGSERGTVAARLHDQAGTQHNGATCGPTCDVNAGVCASGMQTYCPECFMA